MSLTESLTSISYLSRDLSSVVLPARQYLNYPTCRWQTACTATGTTATELGVMSFDRNVIWFCYVAVSLDLSCCCLKNECLLSFCRFDELVFMLSWWTCLVAVSMNLSRCRLDELVFMLSWWTCLVAVLMNLSCCHLLTVLILSCCRLDLVLLPTLVSREPCIVPSLGCLWTCLAKKALHQVPIEHVIQCLTHVIRRHDYTPSLS